MSRRQAPVPPHVFQILLALADRDLHGLGIMHDVHERSRGSVRFWPGALYRTLRQMERSGLIVPAPGPEAPEPGSPRYFRLTTAGRRACAAEATRLADLVAVARARRVLGRGRP